MAITEAQMLEPHAEDSLRAAEEKFHTVNAAHCTSSSQPGDSTMWCPPSNYLGGLGGLVWEKEYRQLPKHLVAETPPTPHTCNGYRLSLPSSDFCKITDGRLGRSAFELCRQRAVCQLNDAK